MCLLYAYVLPCRLATAFSHMKSSMARAVKCMMSPSTGAEHLLVMNNCLLGWNSAKIRSIAKPRGPSAAPCACAPTAHPMKNNGKVSQKESNLAFPVRSWKGCVRVLIS